MRNRAGTPSPVSGPDRPLAQAFALGDVLEPDGLERLVRARTVESTAVLPASSRPPRASAGSVRYTYDYGDNWRHDVIVEEVRNGDPDMEYPAFVDGARGCPPEDIGGPHGFMDFLETVLDPAHEQHRDMVHWYGGPFDPIGLDEERARFGMESMARRRRGPLASHRTGSRRLKR